MDTCVECGASFVISKGRPGRPRTKCPNCRKKRRKRGPFTCLNCGVEYLTNRPKGEGEKYCSRECTWKSWGKNKRRTGPEHFVGVRYREHIKAGYRLSPCVVCGHLHSKWGETCSRECQQTRAGDQLWIARRGRVIECGWCGSQFCSVRGTKDNPVGKQRFCSDECRSHKKKEHRRVGKKIRRARKKTNGPFENISPTDVFERDGWRCRACGDWTPQELQGTYHDNAPELDHIVPLSVGGTHTANNVQCLCRLCNLLKSDMPFEQFKKTYIKQ